MGVITITYVIDENILTKKGEKFVQGYIVSHNQLSNSALSDATVHVLSALTASL